MNVFYQGANGNLIEYWFDGTNWNVHDHGQPANTSVASTPSVVTWNQPGVPVRMNVFYQGANGNLIEYWFDGTNWSVHDRGRPANTAVASTPGIVAWNQAGVPVRMNMFYQGANGNLIEYWFDGTNWNVHDHGQPVNTSVASTPAIVAWKQPGVSASRLNVFYQGVNGNLIEYWFDGTNWNAHDHGQPANTAVASTPAVVAWNQPAVPVRLNAFYEGDNGNLIEYWFDGTNWNVHDHGQLANNRTVSGAAAIAWNQPGCQCA
jgi:hypothetical protein